MNETPVPTHPPWALRLAPPFPSVIRRIMALAANEDSSPQQIARLAKTDPSFSAELLRFANSAMFGASRAIGGLTQAISLLGVDRIRTLAALVMMNRMVQSAAGIETLRKVWVHCLVTALIAEEAAPRMLVDRDIGYTAGLLQDVGALALISAYPDEYAGILTISHEFGFDLEATERDLFDIDHCAAGAWLAKEWDFPDELVRAIAEHHDLPTRGGKGLNSLLQVSWRLADALGFAVFPGNESGYEELMAYLPPASAASWLGGDPHEAGEAVAMRLMRM